MARLEADLVLGQLSKLLESRQADKLGDEELLERFAVRHDEEAFAALLERHGPLVLRVCRRVLHERHDAEDAFQATFLVLARKARAIRNRKALGCWLYGVAYRVAARLRSTAARRAVSEANVVPPTPADPATEASWREVCAVLNEEMARMAEKYRAPLLLCGLEGKTRDEAAQQLGWSLGTLKRRLEQGRSLLRARLAQRGLTLSAVLLASLLSEKASAVPEALATAAVLSARRFAEGSPGIPVRVGALSDWLIRALLITRCRMAGALLLVSLITVGAGTLVHGALVQRGSEDVWRPVALIPGEELARRAEPVTVDRILENYGKKREEIKDFRIAITLTKDDRAFRTRTVLHGEAAGAGTDLLRVDLKSEDNAFEETLLWSGKKLVWYNYNSKIKMVYAPHLLDNGLFASGLGKSILRALDDHRLLFVGLPVQGARERFSLRFYNERDPHYFILEATPKRQEDTSECAVAYAALSRTTYLPRTFLVDDHHGNRTQWDFPRFEINVSPPITLELLSRNLPRGWKEIECGKEVNHKK
jgi:RNA polymerase sigma factor (sigma-70 family)